MLSVGSMQYGQGVGLSAKRVWITSSVSSLPRGVLEQDPPPPTNPTCFFTDMNLNSKYVSLDKSA